MLLIIHSLNVLIYLKTFSKFLRYPMQCFSTRRLWIKQRSSLVNPAIVKKLQFMRIQTELAYIGRQSTTSFNENDTQININKNYKYNAPNKRENSIRAY